MDADQDIKGGLSDHALLELRDYLLIFQEVSEPGLSFEDIDNELVILFRGERVGLWRLDGNTLTFSGARPAQMNTLHSAVLHTLCAIGEFLPLAQAQAAA